MPSSILFSGTWRCLICWWQTKAALRLVSHHCYHNCLCSAQYNHCYSRSVWYLSLTVKIYVLYPLCGLALFDENKTTFIQIFPNWIAWGKGHQRISESSHFKKFWRNFCSIFLTLYQFIEKIINIFLNENNSVSCSCRLILWVVSRSNISWILFLFLLYSADFGLARMYGIPQQPMTPRVVTLWWVSAGLVSRVYP